MTPMRMAIRNRLTDLSPLALALAAAIAAGLGAAGCDRGGGGGGGATTTAAGHTQDDGHDHSAEGDAGHAEGDGHDHGAEGQAHTDEVVLTPEAIERYGIKVEPAQMWALRPTFVAPARVGFNTEAMAHVGSPLAGRATEIKVRLGDEVAAGQELVVVESPDLGEAQADYFQKRVAHETAAPAVELAKVAWERARGLYENSEAMSLTEVQRREAEHKAALAAQRAAAAAAVGAENRLHLLGMTQDAVEALAASGEIDPHYTIRAPIAGRVVDREITLGELVGPERESLLVLADTRTLWVLADVPESHLAEVAVGATAWVTVGTAGGAKFEGHVAFISPLVDPLTRTGQVRIEVPTGELALRPGMFAKAEIVAAAADGQEAPPVVAVPDEAVQTVEGELSVFVPLAGEANTFQRRAVDAGKPVGGLVPIHSGLVEGERFVAAGTFMLKAELGKSTAEHVH